MVLGPKQLQPSGPRKGLVRVTGLLGNEGGLLMKATRIFSRSDSDGRRRGQTGFLTWMMAHKSPLVSTRSHCQIQ